MTSTTDLDHSSIDTFAGPLVVVTDAGVVVAAGFAPLTRIASMLPAGLAARGMRGRRDLGAVTAAVHAYLGGDLAALDAVPVRQQGGPFTQEVWRVMREIPAGQRWTYAELATMAGRPSAARAAGNACAGNQVAPFVPCHRVVRTSGGLGGYAYGLAVKERLLLHEAWATGDVTGQRPRSGR